MMLAQHNITITLYINSGSVILLVITAAGYPALKECELFNFLFTKY